MAQPLDAHLQTLYPLTLDGARWMPYVFHPSFSPLDVLLLPVFSIFCVVIVLFGLSLVKAGQLS